MLSRKKHVPFPVLIRNTAALFDAGLFSAAKKRGKIKPKRKRKEATAGARPVFAPETGTEQFMAIRKVYLSLPEYPYVKEIPVTFPWANGSKQQNIQAVQDAFHDVYPDIPALEVSLASAQPEGVEAAAMKLPFRLASADRQLPVGIVYEASRVFENGGPYPDLLEASPQKVRKDARLQQSGRCIAYGLEGAEYPAEPNPYAFFNWLYGCALQQVPERAGEILKYRAFTDLELGSTQKDRNSPARAAAVYAGLAAAGQLDCLASYDAFAARTCTAPLPAQEPEITPEPAAAPEPAAEKPPEPPTLDQMKEISFAPKVKNLLISLAKNAGCTADNAAGIVKAGRTLLLDSYQNALEQGTAALNPEKNKLVFPLTNPETGFATVGQLTRCPSFLHGWKLGYQPCGGATAPEPPEEPAPLTAETYLTGCGYTIARSVPEQALPPLAVQKLAWDTGEALRDPVAAAFLQFIRSHLQYRDSFAFRMPKDASQESRERVVDLAQRWDHMGLFAELNVGIGRIVCTLASDNEVVRNFVGGHWLELYVVHCVQKVLDRWRTEQDAAVSVCSNVILSDAPDSVCAHELDVAFTVNNCFFWIEAKSSSRNIDYGKYADLCKKLQVTPDQLLLVNSDLTEEDCRGVAYFWPYRIANCGTMEQALEEMIQNQLHAGTDKTGA